MNPGEGFNLRRDVYMRVANLVYLLNRERPWVLVLPPWVRMWHWRSRDVEQERLKWSAFFDVESLGKHVPVIELEDYIKSKLCVKSLIVVCFYKKHDHAFCVDLSKSPYNVLFTTGQDASAIDEVYYLQGVDSIDDWNTIKIDKCERDTSFRQVCMVLHGLFMVLLGLLLVLLGLFMVLLGLFIFVKEKSCCTLFPKIFQDRRF